MLVVGGQNLSLAVPTRYVRPLLTATDAPRPFSASALPRREEYSLVAMVHADNVPSSSWRRQVMDQMQVADSVLRLNGLHLATPVRMGAAPQGTRVSEEVVLEAGVRYFVIGRCDADCSDVDLRVMDGADAVVGTDQADDDYPAVSFVTRTGGTYRAEVHMTACTADPCAYGVAVYRLDPGAASMHR